MGWMPRVSIQPVKIIEVGNDRELMRGRASPHVQTDAHASQLRDLLRQRPQQRHPMLPLFGREFGNESKDRDVSDHSRPPWLATRRCWYWAASRTGALSAPYPAYPPRRSTTSRNTVPMGGV